MISLFLAALAATVSVAHESPAPASTPAPERKICKTESDSSSRLGGKRICRTESEWKAIREATSRDLEGRQRR